MRVRTSPHLCDCVSSGGRYTSVAVPLCCCVAYHATSKVRAGYFLQQNVVMPREPDASCVVSHAEKYCARTRAF